MLTRYYCVLVLDQESRCKRNKLGIDIRPPLDLLMGGLERHSESGSQGGISRYPEGHQSWILSYCVRASATKAGAGGCKIPLITGPAGIL